MGFAVIDLGATNAQPRLEDVPDFDCGGGHMRPVDCCRVYYPGFDRFLKFCSEAICGQLPCDGWTVTSVKRKMEDLLIYCDDCRTARDAQRIHCD